MAKRDENPRWTKALADLGPDVCSALRDAIKRYVEGDPIRRRESRAVKRLLDLLDYGAAPTDISVSRLAEWAKMPRSTIRRQAAALDLPISGGVDLARFIARVFELLTDHYEILTADGGDGNGETSKGPASPYLELLRQEHWRMAVLERQEREGAVVSVRYMKEALLLLVSQLRAACERLQERFGDEAMRIIEEALTVVEDKSRDLFSDVEDQAAKKSAAEDAEDAVSK